MDLWAKTWELQRSLDWEHRSVTASQTEDTFPNLQEHLGAGTQMYQLTNPP